MLRFGRVDHTNSNLDSVFRSAVLDAAARAEVRQEVQGIYQQVTEAIDRRRPVCEASGRCCRFEQFGHRLFVTTMELAAFIHALDKGSVSSELQASVASWQGSGCPFQVGRLCGVHAIRPFGCRIFFCDSTSTAWQAEQYEQFHAALKRAHDRLRVPYYYVEWRAALRALRLNDPAGFADGRALPAEPP